MTVWQKISDFADAVGDAGGGLLGDLAHVFGLERNGGAPEKRRRLHHRRHRAVAPRWRRRTASCRRWRWRLSRRSFQASPSEADNVERVFNLAKQDVAGYEAYADEIAKLLKDDRKLLQDVLEGLMHVAAADGVLHPQEDAYPVGCRHALRLLAERVPLLPRPLHQ